MNKIDDLMDDMYNLLEEEQTIYLSNLSLLPALTRYIRFWFGLGPNFIPGDFSLFNTYINKDYEFVKNHFSIIRMLRAIEYYKIYSRCYYSTVLDPEAENDINDIKTMISYDYPDVETLNTLSIFKDIYGNGDSIVYYNKYKTLFMFTNPSIEFYFMKNGVESDHPFIPLGYTGRALKLVQKQIVKGITAIQTNKVINLDEENAEIVNPKLTFKQKLDILFKYNDINPGYKNRSEMLKNDFNNNMEEVSIIFTFLQQIYINIDAQAVFDTEQILIALTYMDSIPDNCIRLSPKVVHHFFNTDEILKDKVITRSRTKDSENNNTTSNDSSNEKGE